MQFFFFFFFISSSANGIWSYALTKSSFVKTVVLVNLLQNHVNVESGIYQNSFCVEIPEIPRKAAMFLCLVSEL